MKQAVPTFVITITGICITLLIMSVIFLTSDTMKDTALKVDNNQRKLNGVQRDDFINYEGAACRGSEIVNIIKKHEDDQIFILADGTYYNYYPSLEKKNSGWKDAKKVLVPSKLYYLHLIYNNDGEVIGIDVKKNPDGGMDIH